MSNKTNHRRGEARRTETGPRYENPNPGAGCNATHVARGRARWKRRLRRDARRAGAATLCADKDDENEKLTATEIQEKRY